MTCSETDYAYLRRVVMAQSCNRPEPLRNTHFDSRLAPVIREAGVASLKDLVSMLRNQPSTPLHRAVAEAMTINETSFFRDVSPFETLRTTVLPELIRRNAERRTLRIWSAASSTGQEAYSLAMLLCESFPEIAGWDITILGTDISSQVVEYARAGRYRRLEVNRGLPARFLLKYFTRHGDEWEIAPQIRRMCSFRTLNLCGAADDAAVFDLVLLRNVLLYFSGEDRACVLRTMHRRLHPDGYLFLGAAEQAEDSTELFRPEFARNCYFYRPVTAS